MTEERLQKLVNYVSLSHVGFTLILISLLLYSNISSEITITINQSLCYLSLAYVLLYSLAFSVSNVISKGYKTDELSNLRGLGRRTYVLPFLLLITFVLLFLFPLFIGYQSYLFHYAYMPSSLYFILVLFDLQIVFSVVYLYRILNVLYFDKRIPTIRFSSVEPGILMSLLFSIFIVILFIALSSRIIDLCMLMIGGF